MNELAVLLKGFGPAAENIFVEPRECADPGPGEILLEMLAAPINPADLNVIEGKYGELPELPAVPGSEGCGRVQAVGDGVETVKPGDLVAVVRKGTWARALTVREEDVHVLPEGTDAFQGAMLGVNPPTAFLMLDMGNLEPGDWVVQNAANSGVGRSVIQIAREKGWKTLNVVRRPELIEELLAAGADEVVLEDVDLRSSARELCGGRSPRLGLNAVGGASALNLANALAPGGMLVTYGAMGRQPLKIPNGLLIFKDLSFKGFWLSRWKKTTSPAERQAVFSELGKMLAGGRLHVPVHRSYPVKDIHEALAEASAEKRGGKVLLDLAV